MSMVKRLSTVSVLVITLAVVMAAQAHETVYISAFPGDRMEDGGVFFGPDPAPYYPGVRPRAGLWLDWVKGGAVRRITTTLPPDNVQSVEFIRYTLRLGETRTVEEMKGLGLRPITLKGGRRDDIDAQPVRR